METIDLLNSAFEAIYEGRTEDAAHIFRQVAEDIEQSGCPDMSDMSELLYNLYDQYAD